MRKLKNLREKEDGVTLIIIALSMTAIMSIMALVLDVGLAFYNRSHLQASCDAAALAAVRYMDPKVPNTATLIKNGQNCFNENYSADELSKYSIENGDGDYKIDLAKGTADTWGRMKSPTGFAKVLGINFIEVGAHAQAIHTEIPSPKSGLGRTLTTHGKLHFDGVGQTITSIHSNTGIRFSEGDVYVSDIVSSVGTIDGAKVGDNDYGHIKPPEGQAWKPTVTTGAEESDVKEDGKRVLKSLAGLIPESGANTSGWPVWNNSTEDSATWTKNGEEVTLKKDAKYKGEVSINESSSININHDLFIDGNLGVGGPCTIAEGATVYVTGNFSAHNGLECNGNLVIMGDILIEGNKFTSTSESFSYIYVGGEGTAQFGTAGAECKKLVICAPNCTTFNMDGGSTNFIGSIMAYGYPGGVQIGSSGFSITYPTDGIPDTPMVHAFRLSQ